MNSLQLTSTYLVAAAYPGRLPRNQVGIVSAMFDINLEDNTSLVSICDS